MDALVKPKKVKKAKKKKGDATVSAASLYRVGRANEYKATKVPRDVFKPYKPHPDVVPEGAPVLLAMDDASVTPAFNTWARQGNWGAEEGQQFLGFPLLSLLAQRGEYRLIAETIATESTRNWLRFKSASGQDKSKEIKEIEKEITRLALKDKARKVSEHDSYFGRGHWFLDFGKIEGKELTTDIGGGKDDLSRSKVGKGELKDVRVVEPLWIYPQTYDSTNPLSPNFYRPQTWFVFGQMIHSSRLLSFVSREVPDLLKAAYGFAGLSMSQMVRPYIDNWLEIRQAVTDLIKSFTTFVLSTSMGDVISGGAGDSFLSRLQFFTEAKNNLGIFAIDKTKEDFKNVSANLNGLEGLTAQSQEHISSLAQMPLVKLTGISPSGLNASGDSEMRCWEDRILAYQEAFFRPRLIPVFNFIQLSLFDKVDEDIIFEFVPLKVLTDSEEAELRRVNASTGEILIRSKVVTTSEERGRVATDLSGPYHGLNTKDEVVFPLTETEKAGIAQSISTAAATLAAEGLISPRVALEEIKVYSEITGFGTKITPADIAEADDAPPMFQEQNMPDKSDLKSQEMPLKGGKNTPPKARVEKVTRRGTVSGRASPSVTGGPVTGWGQSPNKDK